MDNPVARLREGAVRLQLALEGDAPERLWSYAEELLRWNSKMSLTAVTQPLEVVEKHLLDSLSVWPEVAGAASMLDLGAGAGLPGIPLAVALPALQCTLVDAVAKKVAFMKAGAVKAGVTGRVRAIHARANGRPSLEGLPAAEVVISRAFMDVAGFVALARPYVQPGGRVVAMLGRAPALEELEAIGRSAGFSTVALRRVELPFSADARAVASFSAGAPTG